MTEYAFFSQGVDTATVSYTLPYLSRIVLPDQPQGLGEKQRVHHNIAFLLVLAEEEATRDRKYGLLTIWVNPDQARVHSMEEAVGNLTAWVSSGPDWPYTLVQLHEDTCHVPLPKEGHLGTLPQRGAEITACQRISQLEVCQLLVSGPQVAYPIGLNGCEEPIITSLPESLANGLSLTRTSPSPWKLTSLNPWQRNWTERYCLLVSPHKTTPQNQERSA